METGQDYGLKEIVDSVEKWHKEWYKKTFLNDFQYYSQIDVVTTAWPSETPVHLLDSPSNNEKNDPSVSWPETTVS